MTDELVQSREARSAAVVTSLAPRQNSIRGYFRGLESVEVGTTARERAHLTRSMFAIDFSLMRYNFSFMCKPTISVGLPIRLKLPAPSFNNLRDLVPHNAEV
jgi:hypothetical protein